MNQDAFIKRFTDALELETDKELSMSQEFKDLVNGTL